jgi:hypothetical protein
MSNEVAFSILLVAFLLGGVLLLARRPTAVPSYAGAAHGNYSQKGNIRVILDEPPRYKNKETRRIEYNDDGLPTLIEITRDYAIT